MASRRLGIAPGQARDADGDSPSDRPAGVEEQPDGAPRSIDLPHVLTILPPIEVGVDQPSPAVRGTAGELVEVRQVVGMDPPRRERQPGEDDRGGRGLPGGAHPCKGPSSRGGAARNEDEEERQRRQEIPQADVEPEEEAEVDPEKRDRHGQEILSALGSDAPAGPKRDGECEQQQCRGGDLDQERR